MFLLDNVTYHTDAHLKNWNSNQQAYHFFVDSLRMTYYLADPWMDLLTPPPAEAQQLLDLSSSARNCLFIVGLSEQHRTKGPAAQDGSKHTFLDD